MASVVVASGAVADVSLESAPASLPPTGTISDKSEKLKKALDKSLVKMVENYPPKQKP